jgi:glycosyltransferase involved in cell wall biosynthesis
VISVLILTLNEAVNLPTCIESVNWSDDIVILDSYSKDQTEQIAKAGGARFIQRTFDNYASQRNYGLKEIKYKNSWVLMVDADEVVTPELAREIKLITEQASDDIALFRVRRRDYLFGKWIRHSSGYPTWFGRLMRPDKVSVERIINEEYQTDGRVGYLEYHLLHFPFNKGMGEWFSKHNRYSSMEAKLIAQGKIGSIRFFTLFNSDPVRRRKAVKSLVYSLPVRPLLVFIGFYVLRLGFLDGRAGFTFCVLRAYYEFMISCKIREQKRRERGLPV